MKKMGKTATMVSACLIFAFSLNVSGEETGSDEFEYQKSVLTHAINAIEKDDSNIGTYIKFYKEYYDDVFTMQEYDVTDELSGFFLANIYFYEKYDEDTYAHEIGKEAVNALAELSNGNLDGFISCMENSYGYYDEAINSDEEEKENSDLTMGQKNALAKAQNYLSFTAFSYQGLIEQLEYEQFSHEDAVFTADNCGADWNAQAVAKAKSYLEFTSFSKDSLIEQLEYEGFTYEQAVYGAEANGF